jgi:four helix bundle protein
MKGTMEKTTPIFAKTFDFITWLMNASKNFPRSQRFIITKRLLDAGLNLQERLVDANAIQGRARMRNLDLADAELDKVRLYLRLVFRWSWISLGQYRYAALQVTEIGRLLGGWKKVTKQPAVG